MHGAGEGAFRSFDEMLNGDYYGTSRTFYANTSGMGSNYFNFAQANPPKADIRTPARTLTRSHNLLTHTLHSHSPPHLH